MNAKAATPPVAKVPTSATVPAAPAARPVVARTDQRAIDGWVLTCSYAANDTKIGCSAALRVTQQGAAASDGTVPAPVTAMIWTINKAVDGSLAMQVEAQTGVLIPPGVQLKLDGAVSKTLPFIFCAGPSCIASTSLDGDFLKKLPASQKVEAIIQAINGNAYTYAFSAKGVDKVLEAMR